LLLLAVVAAELAVVGVAAVRLDVGFAFVVE
jgi:hypothetical protein